MNEISKITGRKYGLFDYYGAEDAERVIIAMGSVTEAAREAIDYLVANGEKVGMVAVHLYRPFSAKHFLAAVPKTAKTIAVLDRTKEMCIRDSYIPAPRTNIQIPLRSKFRFCHQINRKS